MTKPLVYIGKLKRIEVVHPQTGRRGSIGARRLGGLILAWDPKGKGSFVIAEGARPSPQVLGNIPPAIHKAHRRFHGADASTAIVAEVPDRVGKVERVALIDAIVYEVPKRVKSPTKNGYLWHHKFGDTKHSGNSDKGTKVMPWLGRDADGNLSIIRRPGNIFKVTDWLRG